MRGRHRHRHGSPRFRRLQGRLLVWFLGAIIMAVGASIVTTWVTSTDAPDAPARAVSGHVQRRLAKTWDDPVASEHYVQQLRDTTGLDVVLRRDPRVAVDRRGKLPNGMFMEDGIVWVPISRDGVVLGALEVRTGSTSPKGWRVGLALLAAILVLGGMARRVAMRLAGPLERLSRTAEKFGAGDLSARTGIEKAPRRWVAEEVRDVAVAFDAMADRIGRVVLEQRELLAAISHELRSPLGRARVAIEIAHERVAASDPGAARPLEDADRQLVEADVILGDLLASARAGLADLRTEEVDLGAWVRKKAEGETTGPIEIVVDRSAEKARVKIDVALFGRALHNLFANAWNHGHPKTEALEARISAEGGRVKIAVCDHGPGFPEAVLSRAFEPFVQGGDAARSPGAQGLGLGLSLVRRIVEAHGGAATARNLDGGGAEVALDLPMTPA